MPFADPPQDPRRCAGKVRARSYRSWTTLSAVALGAAWVLGAAGPLMAQPPGGRGGPPGAMSFMVDATIRRTLEYRCVSCHGPENQQGGLRLDTREGLMKGGASGRVVVPGARAQSRLYTLIASGKMPLDEQLGAAEVESIGTWIDMGAPWPQARRAPTVSPDPRVDRYRSALRERDRRQISRLAATPGLPTARGKGGLTPLHHAAVLGTAAELRDLLGRGAKIDAPDDRGVTPLMLAVANEPNARFLIGRGANIDAVADDGTSVLVAAAGRAEADLVRYLLDRGAKVEPFQVPSLVLAARELEVIKALYPRVLDPTAPYVAETIAPAVMGQCNDCLEYLLSLGVRGQNLSGALIGAAANGDLAQVKRLLDLGALPAARGPQGSTALMAAINSDRDAEAKTTMLLAAGADPNLTAAGGRTALNYARQRRPELVPLLLAEGAK